MKPCKRPNSHTRDKIIFMKYDNCAPETIFTFEYFF